MADDESLFSLEVVVESLTNVVVPCLIPAIAFRLLDFPTLVIQKQEKGAKELSHSSKVDIHGTYLIESGKSCLFKMNKEILFSNLERTPLYVMLVDISTSKTKLLASTTLSLITCFEKVLKSIEINGLDVPVVHGHKDIFEMYNLMGTPVSVVKLSYRIFSLGGTINGHVKTCKPSHSIPSINNEVQNRRENLKHIQRVAEDGDFPQGLAIQKETETCSSIGQLRLPTEIQLSIEQLNVETQTDMFNYSRCIENDKKNQQPRKENIINIARPPPLYYYSEAYQPMKASQQDYYESNTRSLEKILVNKRITPKKYYQTVSVQTAEQIETQVSKQVNDLVCKGVSAHSIERKEVIDLPLVNALLRELSLAKQSIMDNIQKTEQPITNIVASKSSGVKSQTKVSTPKKSCVAACVQEIRPPNKGNVRKSKPLRSNVKGVLIQRQAVKFKKVPLKFHTTKTQKLREALNREKHSEHFEMKKDITKRNVDNDKTKETEETVCQVDGHSKLKREQLGRKDSGHEYHETRYKEAGVVSYDAANIHVAVQHSDLVQFNKEDHSPSNIHSPGSKNSDKLSQMNTNTLNIGMPEHYQEYVTPGSNSEWSSHSRKSSILTEATKPMFSNYSPTPGTKNSRYKKKNDLTPSKEAQSSASRSLRGLVDKPIIHLSKEHRSSESGSSLRDTVANYGIHLSKEAPSSDHSDDKKAKLSDDSGSPGDMVDKSVINLSKGSHSSDNSRSPSGLVNQPVVLLSNEVHSSDDSGSLGDMVDKSVINLSKGSQSSDNSRSLSGLVNQPVPQLSNEGQSSDDSGSLSRDAVDKPVVHLSKSDSVEHNYSDEFDSFESEHTTDSNKKI